MVEDAQNEMVEEDMVPSIARLSSSAPLAKNLRKAAPQRISVLMGEPKAL